MAEVTEIERLKLEFEKERAEQDLALRAEELEFKKNDPNRRFLRNPLLLAITAAAIGLFGNILSTLYSSWLQDQKAESDLILEVVKTGNPDLAADNLQFLIEAGLISDQNDKLTAYLNNRAKGTGIFLPEGNTISAESRSGVLGLLDFIGEAESGGNYNAYFGRANNRTEPRFTTMNLQSVLDWQRDATGVNGLPSSAVGKYQIIRRGLQTLIEKASVDPEFTVDPELAVDPKFTVFSEKTQDRFALQLLEMRGLSRFMRGTLSAEDFANNLAKEWASLPVVSEITRASGQNLTPGQSYYAGNGLSKALVDPSEFLDFVKSVRDPSYSNKD